MSQKQKSNQKFGRNAKRSPSMASYRVGNRMAVNKNKAIQKADAQRKADANKTMRVPRGTARNKRRLAKQEAYAAQQGAA